MAELIEFVGCSGAGKSTLATAAAEALAPGAVLASSLITDQPFLGWITNPYARNVVADMVAVPWLARTWSENRPFVRFAFAELDRHAPSTFARLNYKRNIVRRVGIHEMLRDRDDSASVLIDEGAVLSAYHLYVYSTGTYDQGELERFADLVPLPDHIVYVTAPVDALVDRAMSRPDRRRELRSDDPVQIRRDIQRAVDVFDALVSCPRLEERVIAVDDPLQGPVPRNAALERLAALLDIPENHGGGAAPALPSTGEED